MRYMRFSSGGKMKTYYQVFARFSLSAGKPSLVSLSLHSTSEYFPFLVRSLTSMLAHSRFFYTVPQAQTYIDYLYSRYPDSTATPPVLDSTQLDLFSGGSK
jgi:hypothetical protein